jgi:hypothetical protein
MAKPYIFMIHPALQINKNLESKKQRDMPKVILITGAGTGIGAEAAHHPVYANDISL